MRPLPTAPIKRSASPHGIIRHGLVFGHSWHSGRSEAGDRTTLSVAVTVCEFERSACYSVSSDA